MTATELDQNTAAFNTEFKHRAAVFITGMTPAVVTETLCMLLRGECHSHLTSGKNHRFKPTEIHIITTRGDDATNSADVFIKQWKTHGLVEVLNCLKEYGVKDITIDLWFITKGADVKECWVDSTTNKLAFENSGINLTDWNTLKIRAYNANSAGSGDELSDIRTEAENSIAGDYVARVLRGLTHNSDGSDAGDRAIHASMAGGRKTMSGYMKGAMWLLGRAQDRLSHVLVDSDLEANKDWSLALIVGEANKRKATKSNYLLQGEKNEITHSGAGHQAITLTDVPFVRLGALLALSPSQSKLSYSELVTWAETRLKSAAASTISMILDCTTQAIDFNEQKVNLRGQKFYLLLLLAAQKKHKIDDGWVRVGFPFMTSDEVTRFENAWSKAEDNGLESNSTKHKSGHDVAVGQKPYYWSKTVSPLMTNINNDKAISAIVHHTPNAGDGLVVSRDTSAFGEPDGPAQKAFKISDRVTVEIRNFGGDTKDLVIVDDGFKQIPQ